MLKSDDIRDWSIYKITSPSKAIYIGKSCNIATRRSAYSTHNCKLQPLLLNSLLKYGFINHTFDIIETFTSIQSYASEREIFWISTYKSNFKRWGNTQEHRGLNLTDGGEGMLGHKFSDETKLKWSLQRKGKPSKLIGCKVSEETRLKLPMAHKGKHPNKYKGDNNRFSDETKKKIGLVKLGHTYNLGRIYSEEKKKKIADNRRINIDKYPNHRIIEFNGERKTKSEWARSIGISHEALGIRLKSKWSIEKALTTPLDLKRSLGRKIKKEGLTQ